MEHVLRQMALFDPRAVTALDVIAAFDELAASEGWNEADVALALALAVDLPVRVAVPKTGLVLRATPGGDVGYASDTLHERWVSEAVIEGEGPGLWLELIGTLDVVQSTAMFSAARLLRARRLDGADHRAAGTIDHLAALVDEDHGPAVPEILSRLGLQSSSRCLAVAQPGGIVSVLTLRPGDEGRGMHPDEESRLFGDGRTGLGEVVDAFNLRTSWHQARIALAFAAEGTDVDPGPSLVRFEELGAVSLLSDTDGADHPDVRALEAVCAEYPWAAATLDALVRHSSLRLAASALYTHHSTVQSRLKTVETRLNWDLQSAGGRLRLHLALQLRRLARHPVEQGSARSAPLPFLSLV
ncbi:helix-turn-helix domain-containing protein [Citricoccus sp.]|uniref:helix-turn-helix domain-containing protein n=1 Tax=Citricoccus sp. TaxID=1978372 RepID=UPI0028BDF615|nr:helix-turn-helix domain-containing protein [Citricoccus sp.]